MKRKLFRTRLLVRSALDRLRGRALAFNVILTPSETSRGTCSLSPDPSTVTSPITFNNALVKLGSTGDRYFTLVTGATDIPIGILLNDQVSAGDITSGVPKQIAVFGLYAESLPAFCTGAIAAGAEVVADLVTPGYVKQGSGSAGQVIIGRARHATAATGDPVSIIHCVPRTSYTEA